VQTSPVRSGQLFRPGLSWLARGALALAFVCGALACITNIEEVILARDGGAGDASDQDAVTPSRDAADEDRHASADATVDAKDAKMEAGDEGGGDSSDATIDTGDAADEGDGAPPECPMSDGGFVTVASDAGSPYGIAVGPTYLFWTELGGNISRMSLADCSVTVIASMQDYPTGITLAGSNVYWSNSSDGSNTGSIVTMPQSGGTLTTLATNLNSPGDLTNDGTYLYFMPNSNDYLAVVSKLALTGGTVSSLGTGDYGEDIVTTGGWVYWTDYFAESIFAVPAAGGPVATIASGLITPEGIASDGVNVYWTEDNNGDAGTVMSAPIPPSDGGPSKTLVGGFDDPYGITTDGAHVYFGTVVGSPKSLWKVPIGGGSVTTLVAGPTGVNRITIDSKSVYWTDVFGGFVNMAPK
jgi:hypothetical protein